MNLPEEFLRRMEQRLGKDFPAFLRSYETPPHKALRVNTLKLSAEEFEKIAPFPLGERTAWEASGVYLAEPKAGAYVEHFAGLYYLQEPSAMLPAAMLGARAGERVLDLCAAPGGKSTQLAAQTAGKGVLVSNEIDFSRAKILSQNIERMGIKNCAVTNAPPDQIAKSFPAYFDRVLVDAPCSGEGMFKKEPNAIPEWSEQNVARCAARQSDILEQAAAMLREGGRMVYSTCTFSEEENEEQIEAFVRRHGEFRLLEMRRLYPHEAKGEGHFAALLEKTDGGRREAKPYCVKRNAQANKAFYAFANDFLTEVPQGEITTLDDGRMFLVPEGTPALSVRVLRLGVELGEWNGKLFKPAHALVASAKKEDCTRYLALGREDAERYLRGETLACSLADGWCAVGFRIFPLGLGKAVGGTLKNHYPKGLRLRQ